MAETYPDIPAIALATAYVKKYVYRVYSVIAFKNYYNIIHSDI